MVTDRARWLAAREQIRAWEAEWLARSPHHVVDRCDLVCKAGRERWPFLRLVGGLTARRHPERWRPLTLHAWLVAPTGAVIDPTVHQYESVTYLLSIGVCGRRQVARYPLVLPASWPEHHEVGRCETCQRPRVGDVCACGRSEAAYYRALVGPVHPGITDP